MFTTSTVTTAPTHPDSGPKTPTKSSLSQLLSSPPPPPPPAVAVSPPENPSPRRIKSKSSLRSLRSLGSSLHDDDLDDIYEQAGSDKSLIRPSILRRLSPGLAARVKLLDGSHKTAIPTRNPGAVGRIPEEHIKELDSRNKDLSIKIEKRGRSWNAVHFGGKGKQPQQIESTYLEVHDPDTELPSPVELEPVEPAEESSTSVATQEPVEETLVNQAVDVSLTQEVEEVEEPEEAPVAMAAVASLPAPLDIESGAPPNTHGEHDQTDFEKFLQSTSDNEAEQAPPPPPKDSPRPPSANSNIQSYFNPRGLQRPESIYSFSRASFSHQLTQLTSIPLPQPSSLEASIAAIPNAPLAVKSLTGSAAQIQIWIKKASDVLSGLDAEDEVEWAAAGGREGLDGIDKAITRFEGLMNIYVKAIEDVQLRVDIGDVSADSLKTIVIQMDSILQSWADIKNRLRNVKEQVELAMEWEELWNTILGDVSAEVESLSRLLFEIEEKRHINMANAWAAEQESNSSGLDISELETIVEETPNNGHFSNSNRHSILFDAPPTLDTPLIQTPQDDSEHADLIAVFARIQPLRASLAFLPMRLSMFQGRAERIFPSACAEMEERRKGLEKSYRTLEADAEALRKEFSEDRWVLVFRNAGMQARKMFLSVERSISKLQEALETGAHVHNPAGLAKRVESYEAKKQHYVPAIERVISLIEKGVKDQLTVNGETVNLLSDMASRMDALKRSVEVMDSSLTEYNVAPGQHLRDSISTIVTMDSPATSLIDTPGSSPPSSVVMTPANKGSGASLGSSSRRGSSVSSVARSTVAKVRRYSGIPQPTATLTSKKSAIPKPTLTAPSPKPSGLFTPTPAAKKVPRLPPPVKDNRPRWNSSVNTNDLEVGHVYKAGAQFRKSSAPSRTPRPLSMMSRRDLAVSPAPSTARSPSRVSSRVSSRLASRSPNRTGSPTPNRSLLDPPPYSKLRRPPGAEGIINTPRNRQSFAGMSFSRSISHDYTRNLLSPTKAERPGTALGHGGSRRISLLPLPRNKSGRDSSAGTRSKLSERPPWR
ncbi:cortical protein KAR9-domain-containing protein [Aspergillus pseudonomiae]|uniref:Cortical protein KAR9-domain-containing protein n=1 Tax=Aspergillus pseudonomiae TaxID=1506151 RepID=A0A5N7DSZ0_9EURO|nr:cortical protein KAR9-domain-containing protein [Aspergillus pseudonomiae]KAE8409571.1 cortical protein KAR9-domain-containing protein [Aspergillus pseudonomiae]